MKEVTLGPYRATTGTSRLYGGEDRYTWVHVQREDGSTDSRFDPWPGGSVPKHYLLQVIGNTARQDGNLRVAHEALSQALKLARQERDKDRYRYQLLRLGSSAYHELS